MLNSRKRIFVACTQAALYLNITGKASLTILLTVTGKKMVIKFSHAKYYRKSSIIVYAYNYVHRFIKQFPIIRLKFKLVNLYYLSKRETRSSIASNSIYHIPENPVIMVGY